ncbi:hypothetical protein [Dyadobacter diqingensis]|uniref:hypothetical protein n=1 Tax=Dyadobacter diqingensis TaxID=2938121 RepID=UPI0035B66980
MSHNIHFNEQSARHSFFSLKEKAWHGLGQIVQDAPTSTQAIVLAGLDFQVVKAPLQTCPFEVTSEDPALSVTVNEIPVIDRTSGINGYGLNYIFCFHNEVGPPRLSNPSQVIKESIAPHFLMLSKITKVVVLIGR